MIADRRSQIAIRSTIVCDHMETYFCDQTIAEDRTMFYLLRSSAILCDHLRLCDHRLIIWKFCDLRSKRSSTFAMLFAFQPTRAYIFDIFADQNVCLQSALRLLRLYGNSLFCDRLPLFAICDLRSSAIIWKPALKQQRGMTKFKVLWRT